MYNFKNITDLYYILFKNLHAQQKRIKIKDLNEKVHNYE